MVECVGLLLIAAILLYVLLGSDTAQHLHCEEKTELADRIKK